MAPEEFREEPVRTDGAPWLGGLAPAGTSLVQKLRVGALLSPEVQRSLRLAVAEEAVL
jgi:hypothetical protein